MLKLRDKRIKKAICWLSQRIMNERQTTFGVFDNSHCLIQPSEAVGMRHVPCKKHEILNWSVTSHKSIRREVGCRDVPESSSLAKSREVKKMSGSVLSISGICEVNKSLFKSIKFWKYDPKWTQKKELVNKIYNLSDVSQ